MRSNDKHGLRAFRRVRAVDLCAASTTLVGHSERRGSVPGHGHNSKVGVMAALPAVSRILLTAELLGAIIFFWILVGPPAQAVQIRSELMLAINSALARSKIPIQTSPE